MRYAAMQSSIRTERLCLQVRDEGDAEWNHELHGEHDGGTPESVHSVRRRLAEHYLRFAVAATMCLWVTNAAFATGRNRIWSTVGRGTRHFCASWTSLAFNATT